MSFLNPFNWFYSDKTSSIMVCKNLKSFIDDASVVKLANSTDFNNNTTRELVNEIRKKYDIDVIEKEYNRKLQKVIYALDKILEKNHDNNIAKIKKFVDNHYEKYFENPPIELIVLETSVIDIHKIKEYLENENNYEIDMSSYEYICNAFMMFFPYIHFNINTINILADDYNDLFVKLSDGKYCVHRELRNIGNYNNVFKLAKSV